MNLSVPGQRRALEVEASAGAVTVSCGSQRYLTVSPDEVEWPGLATATWIGAGGRRLRRVQTATGSWVERHELDGAGRPVLVDGVRVTRDAAGRVVVCGGWRYGYEGDALTSIVAPDGARSLERDRLGRPVALDGRAIGYDRGGRRAGVPRLPDRYVRDELGRTWTVLDADGEVRHTFLWVGWACLARLDGPVGAPLAAAFLLDATGTPTGVVTPEGSERVARDAFGESLLGRPGVPGLFGGVVHGDHVHFRARVLDPRTGAWDAPDPFDGTAADPRRRDGFKGPLPVERDPGGSYGVCRGDPVARVDPTGEISQFLTESRSPPWFLNILDWTWSYGNNALGVLGLDLIVNLLMSVFVNPCVGRSVGEWTHFAGLSDHTGAGAWGVHRWGFTTYHDRAWTFGHLVFARPDHLEELKDVRAFIPDAAASPRLYGSVLLVEPPAAAGRPFVLDGSHQSPGTDATVSRAAAWTRAGGTAQPAFPGSTAPRFPAGGFHFDALPARGVRVSGNDRATLREVEPATPLIQGQLVAQDSVAFEIAPGRAPARGDQLLLTTDGAVERLARVAAVDEAGSKRTVTLELEPGAAAGAHPRLRGLAPVAGAVALTTAAPAAPSTLTPGAAPNSLAASPGAALAGVFDETTVLRLLQNGAPVGVARVTGRETQVILDSALPGALAAPVGVFATGHGGPERAVQLGGDRQSLVFASEADVPAPGTPVMVTTGAARQPAVVGEAGGAAAPEHSRPLDRELTLLTAGPARCRPLSRGARLGAREAAPAATADFTFAPAAFGTTPAATVLWLEPRSGSVVVREVTGLTHELALMGGPLPGAAATPYTAERFRLGEPDLRDITLQPRAALQVTGAAPALPAGTAALEVHVWPPAGGAGAATIAGLTLAGARLRLAGTPPAGAGPEIGPGQLVRVESGATAEPAVVKSLRLELTLAHDVLAAAAAGSLELVQLEPDGPTYAGRWKSATQLVVLSRLTTGGVRTELPRMRVGELLRVGDGATDVLVRVAAVAPDSTLCTVDHGPALPGSAAAPNLSVTRLAPVAPPPRPSIMHHSPARVSRSGIDGTRTGPSAYAFSVWHAGRLTAGSPVAVTDGAETWPTTITAVTALEVELAAAPTVVAAGPADLRVPDVLGIAHATRFPVSGDLVILDPAPPAPLIAAPHEAIAVPLVPRAGAQWPGVLSSGTVTVPDVPEARELERIESLIEHELRHTQQSIQWGPLLLAWIPLWLVEGIVEATTDVELPEFGPYHAGTVTTDAGQRLLAAAGLDAESDDQVQVSGADGITYTVRIQSVREDGQLVLGDSAGLANGSVQARKVNNPERWPLDLLSTWTHGGATNLIAGTAIGGLIHLIASGINALTQIGGEHDAVVSADGSTVELADLDAAMKVEDAREIVVFDSSSTIARGVAGRTGAAVRLSAPVPLRGDVQVRPFSGNVADNAWDMNTYFRASIPDASKPNAIQVEPRGDDRIGVTPHDRVEVRVGPFGAARTNVTSVGGDVVEVASRPGTGAVPTPGDVLIAKVADQDAIGTWDSYALNEMGDKPWTAWLRWVSNPYGMINVAAAPEPASGWDVFLRIVRYMFGTRSWAGLPFGYWFWDNAIEQGSGGQMSRMEQDAAQKSGDLYSWLGRLRNAPTVVGDVGHYWLWEQWRGSSSLEFGFGDQPGVHALDRLRVMPSRTAEVTPPVNDELNKDSTAPTVGRPGDAVASAFASKTPADLAFPTADHGGASAGFRPVTAGWVPTSAKLQRASGQYVAFTAPTAPNDFHRVTVFAPAQIGKRDRDPQDGGLQKVFYDLTIAPVTVRGAGVDIVENAPAPVTLVVTQEMPLTVSPADAVNRVYDLSVCDPAGGAQRAGALRLRAGVTATTADEDVEVSRVYTRQANGSYSGGAMPGGVHLGPDKLHIPVRRFSVRVIDVLEPRVSPTRGAAAVAGTLAAGASAWVLVPTDVIRPLGLATGAPAGLVAVAPFFENDWDDEPDLATPEARADLRALLGPTGQVFRVRAAAAPPAAATPVQLEASVGRPGHQGTVRCTVTVGP